MKTEFFFVPFRVVSRLILLPPEKLDNDSAASYQYKYVFLPPAQ